MNIIHEIVQLAIEAEQLKKEIQELYQRKKRLEEEQAILYERIKNACSTTGKTTRDMINEFILEVSENGKSDMRNG